MSQPVVIFTRDVVLRATLTDNLYTQRVIETARAGEAGEHGPAEVDFRFASAGPAQSEMLGLSGPPLIGFGCLDPDSLKVERRTGDEIVFPGCADFPYPLVRCGAG